jgi:CBS domain-containing protein
MSVLMRFTVWNLVKDKMLLFDVAASTRIIDVLMLLKEQKLLSVPVFSTPGSWTGAGGAELIVGGKQYIGIVSVLDLVAFIFRNSASSSEPPATQEASVHNAITRPVSAAIGCTEESLSLWVEPAGRGVLAAMEQFSKGVHRSLVVSPSTLAVSSSSGFPLGEVKLLTQTDVVKFLLEMRSNSASLERLFNATLCELPRADSKKNLVSVAGTDSLSRALDIMILARVHGVPVVDDAGHLETILSISDLRGVLAAQLPSIRLIPVRDFLRQKEPRLGLHEPLPKPLTCTSDNRLGEVAQAMIRHRFHRIWIINSDGQPTDVVTLTDVIYLAWNAERSTYSDRAT